MQLSRQHLGSISADTVSVPEAALFELPEKVLQFGTGVLLRGLPGYFIHKANRQGLFNGRIVVVKSTARGDTSAFDRQDGLFTLCVRGRYQGRDEEELVINSAISRVLNASHQWKDVLACAHNPALQVVLSNTTEVGIQLVREDIRQEPPASFPAKLLAFLYERFRAFGGSAESGLVIVPTELIPENGDQLKAIVTELCRFNHLEPAFAEWLEQNNRFCNSLVDRIVPGKPDDSLRAELEARLGYTDELLTVSEAYRLWAIEGDEAVRRVLSFAAADSGVRIEPDIHRYRELKLRLLNGTHTLSCGLAYLAGCTTVRAAMNNEPLSAFISRLMLGELAPAIPYPVDAAEARAFGLEVLDRFRNPHIHHLWINITVQYSSKMKMRCVPVLLRHYSQTDTVPEAVALGFAAYLWFMKAERAQDGTYYGTHAGRPYPIQDDLAPVFYRRWQQGNGAAVVHATVQDTEFWGHDLSGLPGFAATVLARLEAIQSRGMPAVLREWFGGTQDAGVQ
ncbi:MAG TPA: tagaturonate reductase [Chitinophagaceae bacterium]|jgi:tagaturonate reductase|nr:tagaturonate reductase [Chitinophagaceae bacterium]